MKVDLDDVLALHNLDASDVLHQLREVPMLMERDLRNAKQFADGIPLYPDVHEIVLCGVGGGAVSVLAMLKALVFDECPVPLTVMQAYRMPAYVNRNSLVIIANYSGESEEVVSAYRHAVEKGAQVVAITSGGTVKKIASDHRHALFELPKGQSPRYLSTGYFLLPLLMVLERLNLIGSPELSISQTIETLHGLSVKYGVETAAAVNPAKQFAMELDGLIPVIYGTLPYSEAVAIRFKNQLAESGKVMSFSSAFSVLNHDEAFGWDADSAMMRHFHFTLIHDAEDNERMSKRLKVAYEVLKDRANVKEIRTEGRSRMERLCTLGYLFDFASVYVALRRGVNPSWSQAVNEFRKGLNR